jgi:CheY-like chemotaxis protein
MSDTDASTALPLVGNPTVLVADDEELMREVVSIMIEDNGGTVLEAADGQEAVDVFKANQEKIDCVFLDFSMPHLNGYEAYCEMYKLNASVKALFVSGLNVTSEVQKLVDDKRVGFLNKPFHEHELLQALNRLREL